MKHYSQRFPENQFLVSDPKDNTFSCALKPACCMNALKIWQQKKKQIPEVEIIHQVSDVYRRQNTGTRKNLRRNSYFTIPDYHMTTTETRVLEDFLQISRYRIICFIF